MSHTPKKFINENYEHLNFGARRNLLKICNHGLLAGTGKMLILPVDQGIEHGPTRAFASNIDGFDPAYHLSLARECGFNAFAAPKGLLEACGNSLVCDMPLILKLNSANLLNPEAAGYNQAMLSSIDDALALGCSGVGLTIYPGSTASNAMFERASSIVQLARAAGLVSIIWSYPRGPHLGLDGQTAIDVVAYAAHIAAQIGADIIKVKLPSSHIEDNGSSKLLQASRINLASASARVSYVMRSSFAGKRFVLFSGGGKTDDQQILEDVKAIKDGGGSGSIIGRNSFQRAKADAKSLIEKIAKIYNGRG